MKFLSELKVAQLLLIMIAVLAIGFLAVGGAFYFYQSSQNEVTTEVEKYQSFAVKVSELDVLVLTSRRHEKDFLLRFDDKYVARHAENTEKINALLTDLKANAPTTAFAEKLAEIETDLKAYREGAILTFDEVIRKGLNEDIGLRGKMRDAVHNVEDEVNAHNNDTMLAKMLMMRRHEKDFIIREDEKYIARNTKRLAEFKELLKKVDLPSSSKKKILPLIQTYYDTFIELSSSTLKINRLINEFRAEVHKAEPVVEKLLADSLAQSNLVAVDGEKQKRQFLYIFLGLLALIAALVTAAVYFISKLIQNESERLNDSVINLLGATADLSDRDFTVKVPVAEDITGAVSDALNMMTGQVSGVLNQVTAIARNVQSSAELVQNQGEVVTNLAEQERAQVETTMQGLNLASDNMNQISELSNKCNDFAATATSTTEKALQQVLETATGINGIRETIAETEKRIKRLGERSQEISSVVDIINSVAERTQVLALNASMQAAAAGEAGKGFSVVADEVQRLAQSSRESTSEISTLVSNIQSETAETMGAMNKAISQVVDGTKMAEDSGNQMRETQKATSELVELVRQVASSSEQQAKSSLILRDDAKQIVDSTEKTAEQLDEQSVATQNLVELANKLNESVSVFKLPE